MRDLMSVLKEECYRSEPENNFPENLGLLEEFRRIKIQDKSFLKDVSVLFIQHHLYPFIGQLKIMSRDGMIPQKTWFVDIPYSTNNDVVKKIQSEYTNHEYPKTITDPLLNYSETQKKRIKSVILDVVNSKPKKLLVIDDGAYFIQAIHELSMISHEIDEVLYNRTYLIEQTTKGHRYLQSEKYSAIKKKLNIPIVSIARSRSKLEIESPFIGIACKKAIEQNDHIMSKIKESAVSEKNNLRLGIIGYGAIGQVVYETLREMIKPQSIIDVIEVNVNKWQEIQNKKGNPLSELADTKYDMLFGCTGTVSFSWYERNKMNIDGLLISVSSSDIEFSRFNFIEFANLYPNDPITIKVLEPDKGIHSDLLFEDTDTRIFFINAGFPVNFTGGKECVPRKFIQPTHALLYAASYQVLNQPITGLQDLNPEYDNWIYYNAFNY
jgi:hypothetical protein